MYGEPYRGFKSLPLRQNFLTRLSDAGSLPGTFDKVKPLIKLLTILFSRNPNLSCISPSSSPLAARTYSDLILEPPEKTPFCDSRLGKISPLLGALGTKRQFFNAYNNIWLPPVQILAVFGHQRMKFFGVIQVQTGTLRRKISVS